MEPIHFPTWWDIHNDRLTHVSTQQSFFTHGSGRALFADWGRLGNVHSFSESGNLKLNFQFDESVKYENAGKPYYFSDEIQNCDDNIKLNAHLFIADREITLNKYRHLRQITNRGVKEKTKNQCKKYIASVNNSASIKKLTKMVSDHVPISLAYAAENYSNLISPEKCTEACKTSSSMYSGGCIKTFSLNDVSFVARCAGAHLGNLQIDKYGVFIEKVYPSMQNIHVDDNRPIFEIDCINADNECRLLIRRLNELEIFLLQIDDNRLEVVSLGSIVSNGSATWFSGRSNHCWNGEVVGTTLDGILHIDVETMKSDWQLNLPCLSSVIDSWSEVHPVLPMQWIHATRSECNIVDCRRNPFEASKPLFSISDRSLSSKESFCHITALFDMHYFHLFSSFNGNLLDIRMPGRQVSQWTVPMLNPVSYSATRMRGSRLQCVLGTQMNARHCIFDVELTSKCKSTSLVSSPDFVDPSPMSLGVAILEDQLRPEVSAVLTLDDRGRVLRHDYRSITGICRRRPQRNDFTVNESLPVEYPPPATNIQQFDPEMDYASTQPSFDNNLNSDMTVAKRWLSEHQTTERYKNERVFDL